MLFRSLELKDQATPCDAPEIEEVDNLTAFYLEAEDILRAMPSALKRRLEKFCNCRAVEPPVPLASELSRYLGI